MIKWHSWDSKLGRVGPRARVLLYIAALFSVPTACSPIPASSRSTSPPGPKVEATKQGLGSREGAGDARSAREWVGGGRRQGSLDTARRRLEARAVGYLRTVVRGPASAPRRAVPPSEGQRARKWGVPRANQRPGSNPDTRKASHGAGESLSSLETRRAASS